MINMLINMLTWADVDNKFSNFFLNCLQKIAELFNKVLFLIPDDPGLLNEIDVSKIVEYKETIHYFVPLGLIISVLVLSVSIFLTIEIGMLIYKILLKIGEKVASAWTSFIP